MAGNNRGNYYYTVEINADKAKKGLTLLEQQTEKLGNKMKEVFSLSKVFDMAIQSFGRLMSFVGNGFKELAKYNKDVSNALNTWALNVQQLQLAFASSPFGQTLIRLLDEINARMGVYSEKMALAKLNIEKINSSTKDVASNLDKVNTLTDKQVQDQLDLMVMYKDKVASKDNVPDWVKDNLSSVTAYINVLKQENALRKDKKVYEEAEKQVRIAELQYKLDGKSKDNVIDKYKDLRKITTEKEKQLEIDIKLAELQKKDKMNLEEYKKKLAEYNSIVEYNKPIDKIISDMKAGNTEPDKIITKLVKKYNGKDTSKFNNDDKDAYKQALDTNKWVEDKIKELSKTKKQVPIRPVLTDVFTSGSTDYNNAIETLLNDQLKALQEVQKAKDSIAKQDEEYLDLKKQIKFVDTEWSTILDESTLNIGKNLDLLAQLQKAESDLKAEFASGEKFQDFNSIEKIQEAVKNGGLTEEGASQKIKALDTYQNKVKKYLELKDKFDKSLEASFSKTMSAIQKAGEYILQFANAYTATMDSLETSTLEYGDKISYSIQDGTQSLLGSLAEEIPYIGKIVSALITTVWETDSEKREKALKNINRTMSAFEHQVNMSKEITLETQIEFYEQQLARLNEIGADEADIWSTEEKILSLREQQTEEINLQNEALKEQLRIGNQKNKTASEQYNYWKGQLEKTASNINDTSSAVNNYTRLEEVYRTKVLNDSNEKAVLTELLNMYYVRTPEENQYFTDTYGTFQEGQSRLYDLETNITNNTSMMNKYKSMKIASGNSLTALQSSIPEINNQMALLSIPMLQEQIRNDDFLLKTGQITEAEYKARYKEKANLIFTENEKMKSLFDTVYANYMGETDTTKKAGLKTYLDDITNILLSQDDINSMKLQIYEDELSIQESITAELEKQLQTKISAYGLDLDNLYTQREIASQLRRAGYSKSSMLEYFNSVGIKQSSNRGVNNIGQVNITVNEATGQTIEGSVNSSILSSIFPDK